MKEKIIQEAKELFLTLGFKSVTMDDIANKLGMSKKTIYTYFSNKTKLIEETTFYILETIFIEIDKIIEASENPIKELYDIKMFVMECLKDEKTSPQFQLQKYYPSIYEQLKLKQFEKMHGSVKKSLEDGVEKGFFRSNIDSEFISRMYFNGMTGIKDERIFPSEMFKKDYLMENYLEYHLRAIVTENGMKTLNQFIKTKQ